MINSLTFFSLFCFIIVALGKFNQDYVSQLFSMFNQQYQKTYSTPQEQQCRLQIFSKNLDIIAHLQILNPQAQFGITKFTNLTPKEYANIYLTLKPDDPINDKSEYEVKESISGDTLPKSWDWRTIGAVTNVQDQGDCGSCWTFSATGNIEGQYFLSTGNLVDLSEQQLIDCVSVDWGCHGGHVYDAFSWIKQNGGQELVYFISSKYSNLYLFCSLHRIHIRKFKENASLMKAKLLLI